MEDEILVALFVVDFDVGEVGVHAECEVGGKRPRRGCPSKERCLAIIHEGERDGNYWLAYKREGSSMHARGDTHRQDH